MIASLIMALFGRWIADAEGVIKHKWRWITATPVHLLGAVLAVSVALNLWQWHQLAACHAFKAEVKAAAPKAAAAQAAVNHAPAAKSQAIAEKSDAEAPAYYAAVHSAADAHRVRADGPRCASPASVPGADHAASVNDGPAPATDMVARPKADDDLIIAAAARAAQMHADAEALIAAGVAKAAP